MALYPPPSSNVPVFNVDLFSNTIGYGAPNYATSLAFPTAQGAETWTNGTTTTTISDSLIQSTTLAFGAPAQGLNFNFNGIDTVTGTVLKIGDVSANSIAIGSSTAGRTPTITIDTLSTLNTNASPAIAIGTSSSTKTIKIGSNTNSVHCSSLDIQSSAINNITANTGAITIGNNQTDGILNLGTGNARTATGVINIGTGTPNAGSIIIGNSAAAASTSLKSETINIQTDATTGGTVNIKTGATSSGNVNIKSGSAATGTINVAGGTSGLSTVSVNIGTGTTTGTVTIGNSANTVQIDGSLTIGTGKNITLSGTVGPSGLTQLGGYSQYTFALGVVNAGSSFTIGSFTNMTRGIYIVTIGPFNLFNIAALDRVDVVFFTKTNVTFISTSNAMEYVGNTLEKAPVGFTAVISVTSATNQLTINLSNVGAGAVDYTAGGTSILRIA
jgi:hypothetical protein